MWTRRKEGAPRRVLGPRKTKEAAFILRFVVQTDATIFPGIDSYPERVAGEGIVRVGDAAGANDPSQGQGISLSPTESTLWVIITPRVSTSRPLPKLPTQHRPDRLMTHTEVGGQRAQTPDPGERADGGLLLWGQPARGRGSEGVRRTHATMASGVRARPRSANRGTECGTGHSG